MVRLFHAEKWKIGTIAAQLGIHHGTVRPTLSRDGVAAPSSVHKPSIVAPYVPLIVETLGTSRRLPASRLYVMPKEREYSGIVDDKRPTLSGSGTASAGIPATHKGQPVTLDPGGQVTALDSASLVFNKRAWLTNIGQGATNENYGYDAFSRRVMRDTGGVTGDFYSYEGNIVAVTNSASINGSVPSAVKRRILYEGVDQPLWMYDASLFSSVYFETDITGNVRRLRGGKVPTGLSASPLASDLGGYCYTAFGHLVTTDPATPYPVASGQRYDQPLRWPSHWFIGSARSHSHGALVDALAFHNRRPVFPDRLTRARPIQIAHQLLEIDPRQRDATRLLGVAVVAESRMSLGFLLALGRFGVGRGRIRSGMPIPRDVTRLGAGSAQLLGKQWAVR